MKKYFVGNAPIIFVYNWAKVAQEAADKAVLTSCFVNESQYITFQFEQLLNSLVNIVYVRMHF